MPDHVPAALFIFSPANAYLMERVTGNPHGTEITPVVLEDFKKDRERYLRDVNHVVIAAELSAVKGLLNQARHRGFSVGLIPGKSQKMLRDALGLPHDRDALIDTALRSDPQLMDLVLINSRIMLFNATLGRLPLIESSHYRSRIRLAVRSLHRLFGLKLHPVTFKTAGGKRIETAACGCMIVQRHGRSLASRLIASDSSFTDAMVSLVIAAPKSLVEYIRFLIQFVNSKFKGKKLPDTLGYIKSPSIEISTEEASKVVIDGTETVSTPLCCEAIPRAVRVNIGLKLREKVSPENGL